MLRFSQRAQERPTEEPDAFCDVCGAAVYASDRITIRLGDFGTNLHGSCANRLHTKLGDAMTFQRLSL